MAKRYHPDSAGNHNDERQEGGQKESINKERFQQIQRAYEILSCEEKRGDYDAYRGRSYYENQYANGEEGQGDGRRGPYSSEWFQSREAGFDREK